MRTRISFVLLVAAWAFLSTTAQGFYDPRPGRWLSRDPLGEEVFLGQHSSGKSQSERRRLRREGMHPYLFVRNGPVNHSDLLGLDAGITDGNGMHTGIQVEVRDETGKVIGCLKADYYLQGYMGEGGTQGSSGSSSDSSGSSSSSSGDILGGQGRLAVTYCPKDKCKTPTRKIPGTVEQDNRLIDLILQTAGKDRSWFKEYCKKEKCETIRVNAQGTWQDYRPFSQTCNDFTDHALDTYLGYNWCWEIITDGTDLIEQWDERFDSQGRPRR